MKLEDVIFYGFMVIYWAMIAGAAFTYKEYVLGIGFLAISICYLVFLVRCLVKISSTK